MEYRTIRKLSHPDEVHADIPVRRPLSHRERLERWAELLEADPYRRFVTFDVTEFLDRPTRNGLRRDHSMVALAHADPVLRADGLTDDTHGTAQRYFALSDAHMHHIVCQCHCGVKMDATEVARRVRMAIPPEPMPLLAPRRGLLKRIVDWVVR